MREWPVVPMAELIRLYAAYAVALDSQDGELLVSCFTEDVVLESPARTVHGHQELVDWMTLSRLGPVHHAFNILPLTEAGSEFTCRADWTIIEAGRVIATGTYADTVRVSDGGVLRFSGRAITFTWRASPPTAAQDASSGHDSASPRSPRAQ